MTKYLFFALLTVPFFNPKALAQKANLMVLAYDNSSAQFTNGHIVLLAGNKIIATKPLQKEAVIFENLKQGFYKINILNAAKVVIGSRDSILLLPNANKYIYPIVKNDGNNNIANSKISLTGTKHYKTKKIKPAVSYSTTAIGTASVDMPSEPAILSAPPPPPSGTSGYFSERLEGRAAGVVVDKGEIKASAKADFGKSGLGTAGKLTATEVNDFAKWNLWDDLTTDAFAQFANLWQVKPLKRYTVLLQNNENNPLQNATVVLVDANGIALWKAETDNTGRAELWNGYNSKEETIAYPVKINITYLDKKLTIDAPTKFEEQGANFAKLPVACQTLNEVDIVFAVDATGSMGDEINYLKAEFIETINGVKNSYKNISVRTGSVFYKDIGDDYVTRSTPLTSDFLQTQDFINAQKAGGGGDYPEAMDAALEEALNNMQWNKNARTKILFLVLDAPAHTEAVEKLKTLTKQAAAKGIHIIPIAASGIDKSSEYLLRAIALATNGTYIALTNHSGIGDAHITPTTDKIEIETLKTCVQRILKQYIVVNNCNSQIIDLANVKVQPQFLENNITGIEKAIEIKYFPNPVATILTIQINKGEIPELFIADIHGRIIQKLNTQNVKQTTLDVSKYPSGQYLIMYKGEKSLIGKAFIVSR